MEKTPIKITSSTTTKTVITVKGKEVDRSKCRRIGQLYYEIGNLKVKDSGDCYLIDETYYRSNNSSLIWSYTEDKYVLKTTEVNGLVDVVKGVPVFGHFKIAWPYSMRFYYGGASYEIYAPNWQYLEGEVIYNPLNAIYKLKAESEKSYKRHLLDLQRKPTYVNMPEEIYSAADHPHMSDVARYSDTVPHKQHPLDELFKGKTIGVEVETAGGSVPEKTLFETGFVPLKDGSITGWEYASKVLTGPVTNVISTFMEEAAKNTVVNQSCSLHYHIGGFPHDNKKAVVALYLLWYRLQDELDAIVPPYKRDLAYLAGKRGGAKDHCKRLPNLNFLERIEDGEKPEDFFYEILQLFNDNEPDPPYIKAAGVYRHIHADNPKWNQQGRYHAINFIPLLFERKHTVEFRLHSGTVNKYKAIYWLLICNAIMDYAVKYPEKVFDYTSKVRLFDVITTIYKGDTAKALLAYINFRKKTFRAGLICNDMYSNEFDNDNDFLLLQNMNIID